LKTDTYHAFPKIVDNYAGYATQTTLKGGAKLFQLGGQYMGKSGIFEWIVEKGQVTHRVFIAGGKINGIPNKW
jgi:filamentous hemagglutinin